MMIMMNKKKPCVTGVERIRLSKTLSAAGSSKSKTNLELVKLIKSRTGTKLVKYSDAVVRVWGTNPQKRDFTF